MSQETQIRKMAETVYPVFRDHGWEYFDGPPLVYRLAEMITGLVEDVKGYEDVSCARGGRFCVIRETDEEGDSEIHVTLELGDI